MTEVNGSATAGSPAEAGTAPEVTPEVTPSVAPEAAPEVKPVEASSNPFEGISEENKGFIEKNGYKSIDDVLKSAIHAEKMIGTNADRVIKMPDETSTPEEIAEFHKKLGAPEKAEDYKIDVPDGYTEDYAKEAAKKFHELGLTSKTVEEIVKLNNDYVAAQGQLSQTNLDNQKNDDIKSLEQDWGNKYLENEKIARDGATEFGLEKEDSKKIEEAIGTKKFMNMFLNIGNKVADSSLAGLGDGKREAGRFTPEGAQAKYNELKGDSEWLNKIAANNPAAVAQRDRLLEDGAR